MLVTSLFSAVAGLCCIMLSLLAPSPSDLAVIESLCPVGIGHVNRKTEAAEQISDFAPDGTDKR